MFSSSLVNENKLGHMKPLPLVLSMALPLMLSMALQAIYNIADSLFISRYSEASFAAVSIIQPLILIFMALSNGIAAGEGSLLSKLLGEGDEKRAMSSVGTAWTLSLGASLLSILLVLVLNRSFVDFFLRGDPTGKDAVWYLMIVALGFPFLFASSLISFILQSHGMSRSVMLIQGSGAVLNIVLDPVFIFSLGLGAPGAAVATSLGYLLSAVIALYFYFSREVTRSYFRYDRKDARRIFQIALPSMMVQAASPVVGVVLNKLIVGYGVAVMAVYGMYLKTESFMFLAASGIGNALIVITGYNYGRGDYERVRKCYLTSLVLSWSIMLLGFIFFQVFSREIVGFFTSDPVVLDLGENAFHLLCFCFLLTSPNIITGGLLQGLGLGQRSMVITYARFFVFLLPLAFLMNAIWGLTGIWLSFFAADVPTFFLIIHIYRKTKREMLSRK